MPLVEATVGHVGVEAVKIVPSLCRIFPVVDAAVPIRNPVFAVIKPPVVNAGSVVLPTFRLPGPYRRILLATPAAALFSRRKSRYAVRDIAVTSLHADWIEACG